MNFNHKPVMLEECMNGLNLKPDGVWLDGTLGGGGHSIEILKRTSPNGKLIAIDKDSDALISAAERLSEFSDRINYVHDDFKNAVKHIERYAPDGLDGALLDLGVSSYQLDTPERGFSYIQDGLLDMRMNQTQFLTAFNVVNEYTEYELVRLLYNYGEEKFARKIASNIVKARNKQSIRTTTQLAEIVANSIPMPARRTGGNPCKKTFQAIRIEVNGELEELDKAVQGIARKLKKGGRMCVITFHSLEDRIVKNVFREMELDCVCDKSVSPICTCNKVKEGVVITRKPIEASSQELLDNRRAQSAKLRIFEKI